MLTDGAMQWLRDHHGVASDSELLQFGIGRDAVTHMCKRGLLEPVHRGVYRLTSSPLTFEARCRAASAVSPDVWVAGVSAGRLWGLRKMPRSDIVVALVPDQQRLLSRGVAVHRCRALDPLDVVERDDGIRLTSPPRTVLEVAAALSDRDLESVIEQVLDQYCAPPAVWGVLRRLGARGRPGTARLRRVLDSRPIWHKPKDSDLEVRLLAGLRRRGIHLEPQVPVAIPGFGLIHLDGADRVLRWGVEADHVTWHGGRAESRRDIARDRACRRADWQVERVTDEEVTCGLTGVLDELEFSYTKRNTDLGKA